MLSVCFHLETSTQTFIHNILKSNKTGSVAMLGLSLMIVKRNRRYEDYEKHKCIICIFFVSKHGIYPALWSLVKIHLSTMSRSRVPEAGL